MNYVWCIIGWEYFLSSQCSVCPVMLEKITANFPQVTTWWQQVAILHSALNPLVTTIDCITEMDNSLACPRGKQGAGLYWLQMFWFSWLKGNICAPLLIMIWHRVVILTRQHDTMKRNELLSVICGTKVKMFTNCCYLTLLSGCKHKWCFVNHSD